MREKNAELVKANKEVEMNFQRAHEEVAGLIETVENLNAEKRDLQEGVNETAAKFRRLTRTLGVYWTPPGASSLTLRRCRRLTVNGRRPCGFWRELPRGSKI